MPETVTIALPNGLMFSDGSVNFVGQVLPNGPGKGLHWANNTSAAKKNTIPKKIIEIALIIEFIRNLLQWIDFYTDVSLGSFVPLLEEHAICG